MCAPVIELNKNKISLLPLNFFRGLENLERIVLSNNEITSIPVGIACPKLVSFLLSSNKITEVPPDLPLWPKLKILFLNNNLLQRLPETFMQCSSLERLNLARNNKCSSTSKAVLQYLKKLIESKKDGKYFPPDTL